MKTNPNPKLRPKKHLTSQPRVGVALAALLLMPAATVMADSYWQGGTSDFNNAASWNPAGVPLASNGNINADNDSGSNNIVLIQPGDPAWNPWDIRAGNENNTSGAFRQTGGTLTVGGWFRLGVGAGSYGNYMLTNGTVNCELEAHVGEAGAAYMEIDGGTFSTVNNYIFSIGDGDFGTGTPVPTGTLVLNNGTVVATGEFWVAEGNNSGADTAEGHFIMNGGTLTLHNWFAPGRFGGYGDVTLNNGWITKDALNGGNFTMASGTSVASFTQNGGAFTNTLTQSWIGEGGTATYTLNGGQAIWGIVHLGQNAGALGTLNVNGGVLSVTELTCGGGAGTINFNGGTLRAGGSTTTLFHDVNNGVYLQAGGVTIDTAGNDATISQAIADGGGGGLTKTGAGALTLSGVNTYSGPTVVNEGELDLSTVNTIGGSFSVADGTTLGVLVQAANAQVSIPSLTVGTTAGGAMSFDLGNFGSPTVAPMAVSGNLTANGTTVINIKDGLPQIGEFPLIQYGTKSGSGTFTIGTLPLGVVGTIVNNALNSSIDLKITSVSVDVWQGLAGGIWDINTTTNWLNSGTAVPTFYQDGNAVVFNDTAPGTTTISLPANVAPASVTIQNNTNVYTITGNGMIEGNIGLNYQGTAAFTMGNTNGYTGPTTVSAGWLTVSNLANGGLPSGIGAATADATNLVLAGGALSYGGPAVTINRGYKVTALYMTNQVYANSSIDNANNITLTGAAAASGQANFIKTGAGTLDYIGSVTNILASGGNAPGYNVGGGTVIFDGSAGGQSNYVSGEIWVGGLTNAPGNLIVTNTTLTGSSWLAVGRGNGSAGYTSTMNVYNSKVSVGSLSFGYWGGYAGNLANQNIMITNSTFTVANGNVNVAESAGSTANMYLGGNTVFSDNGPLLFGLQSGATGTVVMADSVILTNSLWMSCGANGAGTLIMKDNSFFAEGSDFNFGDYGAAGSIGTFTLQDNAKVVMIGNGNGVYVGKTAGAVGLVTMTGGTLDARSAGVFQFAQQSGSVGTWMQSGGTVYGGGWVSIGRGANSGDTTPTGLLYVSGGVFDETSSGNGLLVGEQGTGTLIVTNTGLVISEAQNIGVAIGWNQGIGTVNLERGGTLVANYVQGGSGTSTLNLDGGTLAAGANATLSFIRPSLTQATILSGGIIDSSNKVIAINQPLLDGGLGGGLKIQGSGTVYLNATNTYSGTTTVASGAVGGSGVIAGPLAVQSGASLAPGLSTLTVNNSVNLAAGSSTMMTINVASNMNSQVTGATSITYGGTLVLQNTQGSLTPGQTFTLFTAGSYSGSFSSIVSQTPGQTVTWDTSNLAVNGTVKVLTAIASNVSITSTVTNGNITLSWPAASTGYTLQWQSAPLSTGLTTNWINYTGSSATNMITLPVTNTNGVTFFRLVH